jgi:putative DNA-invertase from lambdoid prophage Rac
MAVIPNQVSARKEGHQKEISRLIQDAGRRRFDVVLVWSLDRLSRWGVLTVLGLIERLRIYGVRILSYQEAWTDMPGPMAEVLYAVTAWAARYEFQRRSDHVKAGLSRAVKEGRKLGRPIGSKDSRKRKRSSKNVLFGG